MKDTMKITIEQDGNDPVVLESKTGEESWMLLDRLLEWYEENDNEALYRAVSYYWKP